MAKKNDLKQFITTTMGTSLTAYGIFHFSTIFLKYGQKMNTWVLDYDAVFVGGCAFLAIGVFNVLSYMINKNGGINIKFGKRSFASALNADSILEKMGMVKVNGQNRFLYSSPTMPKLVNNKNNHKSNNIYGDTVYFDSYDKSGVKVQIPSEVLWRFLRYAQNNKAYGRGLSARHWQSFSNDWWFPDYYYPIYHLLRDIEKVSIKWIPPNGIQIIKGNPKESNQWLTLMPRPIVVIRMCVRFQLDDRVDI